MVVGPLCRSAEFQRIPSDIHILPMIVGGHFRMANKLTMALKYVHCLNEIELWKQIIKNVTESILYGI